MRRLALLSLILSTAALAQANAITSFPPRVQRALTDDERRFFGQQLIDAVAALNAARADSRSACEPLHEGEWTVPLDPKHPEAAVSKLGIQTERGIEPLPYGVRLTCPAAGGPPQEFSIDLSAKPPNLEQAEVVAKKEGETLYRLHAYDFGKFALLLEVATPAPKEPRAVHAPSSIEVTIHVRNRGLVGPTEEQLKATLEQLSRAPLRAFLLAHRELPAPAAAAPVPAIALSPASRAQAQAEVWRAVLDRFAGKTVFAQVVLTPDSGGPKLGDQGAKFLTTSAPDVSREAIADYDQQLKVSTPPGPFSWRAPVVRVTKKELDATFRQDERHDGWKRFREAHQNALALVTLSRVGLSPDLRQAIVYAGIQSDWLSGEGSLCVYQRTAKGWTLLYEVPLWVS